MTVSTPQVIVLTPPESLMVVDDLPQEGEFNVTRDILDSRDTWKSYAKRTDKKYRSLIDWIIKAQQEHTN